jgi:hypothetical protein
MSVTSRLMIVAAAVLTLSNLAACHFQAGVKDSTGVAGTIGTGVGGIGGVATGGTTGTLGAAGSLGLPPTMTMPQVNCVGLQCQQSTCVTGNCTVTCPMGQRTTISGTIYDPAAKVPLYNIAVYVPNSALAMINDGPSCDPCDPKTGTSLLSGDPVVITTTDEAGVFHLGLKTPTDAPAGTNIPLVIQVGKWRREIMVPTVTACQDTMLTDKNQTRLPATQAEGHIPRIALTTGESDAMECLLRKIGISDMEFTPETATGRVNLYAGGNGAASYDPTLNAGATFTAASPWWDSYDNLAKYDIVMHSCDGSQGAYNPAMGQEPAYPKSMDARTALNKFADLGGRVFASHWHAYWFEEGTPKFMSIATWEHDPGLPNPYDATIDQTFAKGASMAQWMLNVGGSTTLGTVTIAQSASARMIEAATGGLTSQRWIYASTLTPQSVQFISATTPIPNGTCGRAVITDLHVSAGTGMNTDIPKMPFPTGCVTTELTPREKALEFMFFDIASCVQPIIP